MPKLTPAEINALTPAELNQAVAIADGWTTYREKHGGWSVQVWKHPSAPVRQENMPDYTSGALLDRIAREAHIEVCIDYERDTGDYNPFWIAYRGGNHDVSFQSESLTTAIQRAYLYYKQESK